MPRTVLPEVAAPYDDAQEGIRRDLTVGIGQRCGRQGEVADEERMEQTAPRRESGLAIEGLERIAIDERVPTVIGTGYVAKLAEPYPTAYGVLADMGIEYQQMKHGMGCHDDTVGRGAERHLDGLQGAEQRAQSGYGTRTVDIYEAAMVLYLYALIGVAQAAIGLALGPFTQGGGYGLGSGKLGRVGKTEVDVARFAQQGRGIGLGDGLSLDDDGMQALGGQMAAELCASVIGLLVGALYAVGLGHPAEHHRLRRQLRRGQLLQSAVHETRHGLAARHV